MASSATPDYLARESAWHIDCSTSAYSEAPHSKYTKTCDHEHSWRDSIGRTRLVSLRYDMTFIRSCVLLLTAMIPLASHSVVYAQSVPEKPDQFAIVFFYRLKGWPPNFFEPVLLVDGAELARMDNGRYFAIRLEPGKHTFRTEHMKQSLSLELEGGKEYYFEVRHLARRKSNLVTPDSALGRAISETPDKIRLKPLDSDKIIDSSKVIIDYAELKKASK